MKLLMGLKPNRQSEIQGLANKHTAGDIEGLANTINDFLSSVSKDLPRLSSEYPTFQMNEPLPDSFIISVDLTEKALSKVKTNKATGPDNVPPWILKDFAHILAKPLCAIFNSSLREGVVPSIWKSADVVPLAKKHPPQSIENDIRPVSLTPIVAKVFESIILEWVNTAIKDKIDPNQFGCIAGTCTTDALVGLLHEWYRATDNKSTFVRIFLLDYSKAFDLINHKNLLNKLEKIGVAKPLVTWISAFLTDRPQRVRIGQVTSDWERPNGGFPQGTLTGPKGFLVQINDLVTPCPIYKYVDDSTIFEIISPGATSHLQDSVNIAVRWTKDNDMRIIPFKPKKWLSASVEIRHTIIMTYQILS